MGSIFATQSLEMQGQHVEDVFDSKRKGAEGGRLGADKGEDAQPDLENSSMKHGFVKNGDVIECVSSLLHASRSIDPCSPVTNGVGGC